MKPSKSREPMRLLWCLVWPVVAAVAGAGAAAGEDVSAAGVALSFTPPEVRRPAFVEADFPIGDYGARPDDGADDSRAIAAAVEACALGGGGRVVVPPGSWQSGAIHLRSGVVLHLEEGATIRFSDRFEDYLPPVFVRHAGIEIYNYSPLIYARDCVNVGVTGRGVLEGNAERWWDWRKKETRRPFEFSADVPVAERVFGTEKDAIRPSFMVFVDCRRVLLEDFTITSGPNWTIHPIYCEDVLIRGITVDTHGPNNDGIDVDSCRNVVIERCSFNTGDDCVVLKSGYNQDGWRVARPTENVVMRRCRGRNGHGGLVIGSEMSGDVRNVLMHDCEFDGTDHVLRIKSRIDRGGTVEHVYVDGVRGRDLKRDVVLLTMGYTADRVALGAARPPAFRDIVVSDVTAEGSPAAIIVQGLPESPIRECRFENLTLASAKGIELQHAAGVSFRDVVLEVERGPACEARDVEGLAFERVRLGTPDTAHIVIGPGTSEVDLCGCDFTTKPDAIVIEPGVPASVVTVR